MFYPQYFVLFNELVEDWFNDGLGIDFAALSRGGPAAAFRWRTSNAISCRRRKVGEVLRFRLAVSRRSARRSLTLAVEARAGEEVRVRATLVVVLASLETHRPVPFPPAMREKLERFQL